MTIPSRLTSIAPALLLAALHGAVGTLNDQQRPTTPAKTRSGQIVNWRPRPSPSAKARRRLLSSRRDLSSAVIEDAPSFVRGMIISGMKHGMETDRQDTLCAGAPAARPDHDLLECPYGNC